MITSWPMADRKLMDYVGSGGVSVVKEWLGNLALGASTKKRIRNKLQQRAIYLTTQERLPEKVFGMQHGYKNLWAIKFNVAGIEYRMLSGFGPIRGQLTVLFPATEHSDNYRPPGCRESAVARMKDWRLPGRVVAHGIDY